MTSSTTYKNYLKARNTYIKQDIEVLTGDININLLEHTTVTNLHQNVLYIQGYKV